MENERPLLLSQKRLGQRPLAAISFKMRSILFLSFSILHSPFSIKTISFFSYLDKRRSLGRRHFYFYSNRTRLTKIKTPISVRIWYNRPVPETRGKFCRRKHS